MTSIYFLLREGQISRLHRLRSDELWLYHCGSSVALHLIDAKGIHSHLRLGPDPTKGQAWQAAIPHGTWLGAVPEDPTGFCLVSCVVSPGFEYDDFDLGERRELQARFPEHAELIRRLT
jgi:predicted cupin superfamily sugar epimerase